MSDSRLNPTHQQANNHDSAIATVGDLLHTFSDATQQAHAAGIHLSRGVHRLGILAGIGAEIIHDPSSNTAERIVCGVGVGLLREGDKL